MIRTTQVRKFQCLAYFVRLFISERQVIKLYPDRFVGTAIVDPFGPKPGEAMREHLPKGVRAFRNAPNYSKLPPASYVHLSRPGG